MQFALRNLSCSAFPFFLAAVFFISPVFADGQTAKAKTPVAQSSDQRVKDFGDGTILDSESHLMWFKNDSWQLEGKWINWYTAVEYAQKMNNKNFAGYSDWRLPTPEEVQTLYDRRKRNVDKDGDKIYLDRVFPSGAGWSSWTSEEKSGKAVVVSLKDEGGRTYQDKITGVDAFLRLVRGPVS